jgi:hypothetical protein
MGNNATAEIAKQLQDILNSTVIRPILSDALYQPIVAAIILASSFALWSKIQSPTGVSALSWRDALGLALIGCCVSGKWMLEAVALTAAYVAWSSLAARSWNATGKLPGFEVFLASLLPAATPTVIGDATSDPSPATSDSPPTTTSDATTESSPSTDASPPALTNEATPTSSPTDPSPEPTTLSASEEAKPSLPDRNPEEECVVCWTTDENPLSLPCSHLVCEGCLTRLRDANKYTCPYCSTPLFKPHNNANKHLIYQLAVATSGAHRAIILIEAALGLAHGRFTRATLVLFFNLPLALFARTSQARIKLQGEEEYFAEVGETSLGTVLGLSLFLMYWSYGRVPPEDWAVFRDGEWIGLLPSDDWSYLMVRRWWGGWWVCEFSNPLLKCVWNDCCTMSTWVSCWSSSRWTMGIYDLAGELGSSATHI